MDSSRQILRALTLCLLTLWLCACQSTTFADHFSISEITGAASMDIPPKGQIPVDGEAVLAIVRVPTFSISPRTADTSRSTARVGA